MAYCDYTAGLCNCSNHAVATLNKIMCCADQKRLSSSTCIEVFCSWNTGTKGLKSIKIRNTNIQEHNGGNENKQHTLNST